MDTTTNTARCNRCREWKPDDAQGWQGNLCGPCADDLGVHPTRRCSRCGFHVKDWATSSGWCRLCSAQYARERRHRLKEQGTPPEPRLRICKPCGQDLLYPSEQWTASVSWCKSCVNAYARERRQGQTLPPLPNHPLHKMPMLKCQKCGRRKAHRPENFPSRQRPNVCKSCQTREQRESRKRLRDREGWVLCRTCGEQVWHELGGKGWAGNRCPDCSRAAENERYWTRIKPDAAMMEERRRKSREGYWKKKLQQKGT